MRSYLFILAENERYAEEGWRPAGRPEFDAADSAMTLAHDVLEHPQGLDHLDACADELMALGAMHWGRGDGGYFWGRREPNIGPLLAMELESQITMYGGLDLLQDPGRTTALDETTEDEIEEAIRLARLALIEEGYKPREIRQWLSFARGWLRKGYRYARRRWTRAGQDSFTATYLYQQLERAIEDACKYADEGSELRVWVNMTAGEVRAQVFHPWEQGHSEYEPEDGDYW